MIVCMYTQVYAQVCHAKSQAGKRATRSNRSVAPLIKIRKLFLEKVACLYRTIVKQDNKYKTKFVVKMPKRTVYLYLYDVDPDHDTILKKSCKLDSRPPPPHQDYQLSILHC